MKQLLPLILGFLVLGSAAYSAQTLLTVQSDVSVTTATAAARVAENFNRNYLLVQNKGSAAVILKFGSQIGTAEGISIAAGGNYEPFVIPTDAIYLRASSGTNTVSITEGRIK